MNEDLPGKAPIPSPFVDAAPAPAPPQTGNYVMAGAIALASGAAMWFLANFVGMMPVGLLVLGFYFVAAIGATLAVQRAGSKIGWRVRRDNLPMVRRTVDQNMRGAYLMMTMVWPFLLVALMRGELLWAFPIMLFSIPFSMWSVGIEKRFKNMEAEPDAAGTYRELIEAWREACFGLRKEG